MAAGEGAREVGAAVAVGVAQQGDPAFARLGEKDIAVGRHRHPAGMVEAVGEEVDAKTGRYVERRTRRPVDAERRVGRALRGVGWRQIFEAYRDMLSNLWVVREGNIAKQQGRDGGKDGREATLH